jgi:hypothetical protein
MGAASNPEILAPQSGDVEGGRVTAFARPMILGGTGPVDPIPAHAGKRFVSEYALSCVLRSAPRRGRVSPAGSCSSSGSCTRFISRTTGGASRDAPTGRLVGVEGDADLPELVATGDAAGRLASRLHGRQDQPHEHRDDRDHHQQLDERETPRRSRACGGHGTGITKEGSAAGGVGGIAVGRTILHSGTNSSAGDSAADGRARGLTNSSPRCVDRVS